MRLLSLIQRVFGHSRSLEHPATPLADPDAWLTDLDTIVRKVE